MAASDGLRDVITTASGDDIVIGGSLNDLIIDAGGANVILGDNGHAMFDGNGLLMSTNTSDHDFGGADMISTGTGNDIILGGSFADRIVSTGGNNLVLGDNGEVLFNASGQLVRATTQDVVNFGDDDVTLNGGDDIVLGGSGKDLIRASNGHNVVLGDNGFAVFNSSRALIEFDTTEADQGDRDFILLGSGNDIAVGGTAADDIRNTGGNDILIGDNARIVADTSGRLQSVASKDPLISGADIIQSGAGDDVIIGGSADDYIGDTGGRNIVAGDNAVATFDTNRRLRTLTSTDTAHGGADRIAMNGGDDIIVAGSDRDVVNAGNGNNIVLGDHGIVTLDGLGLPVSLTTTSSAIGGNDVIYSGVGDDLVLAGFGNDSITAAGGSNIIVGDNGQVAWLAGGVLEKVNTLDAAVGGADTVVAGAGDDIIIGGTAADNILAAGGNNVVIGDSGCAIFNSARKVVSLTSTDPGIGADDFITSESGNDVVIGGIGNDRINVVGGNNVVLGDNGSATFNASGAILTLTTSSPEIGGADSVFTGPGNDVVLGGASLDILTVGDGRNVVLGDHGNIRFDASGQWLNVDSSESTLGDADRITSGLGNDLIFGGTSSDTIDAGAGDNMVAGDSAAATFNVAGYLLTLTTTNNADGGVDTIRSGAGDDLVMGGAVGDFILPGDGRNVVLGDAGTATFSSLGKLATLISQDTNIGGQDRITTGTGRDIVFAGMSADVIEAGAGNNTIVGDSGSAVFDANANMLSLTTINSSDGGHDMISTGIGKDVVFGGSGGDSITISEGSNLVLGDNGRATFDTAGQWLTVESLDTSVGDNDNIVTGTGDDIVFGGAMNDVINVNNGRNIVVGDSAQATFDSSGAIRTLQTIAPTIGGNDRVTSGTGNDIVFGGVSNDNLNASDGNNVLVGDNASATFDALGAIRTLTTTDSMAAGLDWITTGTGRDAILGGSLNDVLNSGNGVNLVLGDNGRVTFDGAGQWLTVNSIDTAIGGADSITSGLDSDTIFGGMDSDFITASEGRNVVIGDSAQAEFNSAGQILSVTTIDAVNGGRDRITTGTGDDTVFGGSAADNITASNGRNVVAGDNAAATFDPGGQVRTVTTIDPAIGGNDTINSGLNDDLILGGTANDSVTTTGGNNIILGDNGRAFFAADGTIQTVEAINPTIGGNDNITSAAGNDLIIAGTADDTVAAGSGNDLIFGDHGQISGSIRLTQLPLNTFSPDFMFTSIATQATDLGGNDFILAGAGEDIIIGGQGRDRIHAESGDDDVIGGHSVADGHDDRDLIDGGEGHDYIAGDNAWIHREPRTTDTRWRAIVGPELLGVDGQGSVTSTPQTDPGAVNKRTVTLFNHTSTTASQFFGSDIIAGGSENDTIFGQLGNDAIQGDGAALSLSGDMLFDIALNRLSADDYAGPGRDGDDYVEGGGGNDVILGNLGQDDLIGGSSDLFGTSTASHRPDGQDIIFGGSGTRAARNDAGDESANGHARDADVILGDNGNIFRVVGINGVADGSGYPQFAYDTYGSQKIVPRTIQYHEYEFGAANDVTRNDELHGEAGDDIIHGMAGHDVIFGDGQDDDVIGGAGNDRISGGAGIDGILGDDGRIFTSRNGLTEPLHGINTPSTQAEIHLQGTLIGAIVNLNERLKKSVDLASYLTGGHDIIYGGLGDDFIHGGAGDDAISGAEALSEWYITTAQGESSILNYDPLRRMFADYNAQVALSKINGFVLNFAAVDESGRKINDGTDHIFGDEGNDWLVGGTQNDRLFGGMGDDYLNADDNLETNGGLNNVTDGAEFADADFAYGGGGYDVLIGNTGADRLIDWSKKFNSYFVPIVPTSPSEMVASPTVIRDPSAQIIDLLLNLAASGGADMDISPELNALHAELGLITIEDGQLWRDQVQQFLDRDPQPKNLIAGIDTLGEFEALPGTPILTRPSSSIFTATPAFGWTAATRAVRYEFRIDRLDIAQTGVIRDSQVTGTNYSVTTPLVSGARYRVWVRAINSRGEAGGWSVPLEFVIANTSVKSTLPSDEAVLAQLLNQVLLVSADLQTVKKSEATAITTEVNSDESYSAADNSTGEYHRIDAGTVVPQPPSSHLPGFELTPSEIDAMILSIADGLLMNGSTTTG